MRLFLFMGRNIRRNKINPLQPTSFQRGAGQRHMPAMDRVKRSSEKSNVH